MPAPQPQPLLAVTALASGGALILAVTTKTSLALMLTLLGSLAGSMLGLRWSAADESGRDRLRRQLSTGIVAGFLATIAYDASRLLLVRAGGLRFRPFETFRIFGLLLLGEGASAPVALLAGTAYHFVNGMSFAVAYCLLLGGRDWKWALLWALALEAAMVGLYPRFLDLEKMKAEFLTVSALGHLVYGSTLGILSQRWLAGAAGEILRPPSS